MITELTPEQIGKFDEYVQKWTNIGLSTESTNRPEAEKYIKMSYQLANLEEPDFIIWSGSPYTQSFSRAFFMALIECNLINDFYKFMKKFNEKDDNP